MTTFHFFHGAALFNSALAAQVITGAQSLDSLVAVLPSIRSELEGLLSTPSHSGSEPLREAISSMRGLETALEQGDLFCLEDHQTRLAKAVIALPNSLWHRAHAPDAHEKTAKLLFLSDALDHVHRLLHAAAAPDFRADLHQMSLGLVTFLDGHREHSATQINTQIAAVAHRLSDSACVALASQEKLTAPDLQATRKLVNALYAKAAPATEIKPLSTLQPPSASEAPPLLRAEISDILAKITPETYRWTNLHPLYSLLAPDEEVYDRLFGILDIHRQSGGRGVLVESWEDGQLRREHLDIEQNPGNSSIRIGRRYRAISDFAFYLNLADHDAVASFQRDLLDPNHYLLHKAYHATLMARSRPVDLGSYVDHVRNDHWSQNHHHSKAIASADCGQDAAKITELAKVPAIWDLFVRRLDERVSLDVVLERVKATRLSKAVTFVDVRDTHPEPKQSYLTYAVAFFVFLKKAPSAMRQAAIEEMLRAKTSHIKP